MNFHGYLILRGGARGDGAVERFFDPWTGPLATRFAATFVLTAGVGVTLLTRRAVGHPDLVQGPAVDARPPRPRALRVRPAVRRDLARARSCRTTARCSSSPPACSRCGRGGSSRSASRPRSPARASPGGGSSAASTATTRRGCSSPTGGRRARCCSTSFVNGTHPLFPWLAFFCAGIVLGRLLSTDWWRPAALGRRLHAVRAGRPDLRRDRHRPARRRAREHRPVRPRAALHGERARDGARRLRRDLVAGRAVRRTPMPVEVLRHAGAMSLTLYIAHGLVFNLVVDWLGWIEPGGLEPRPRRSPPPTGRSRSPPRGGGTQRYGIGPAEWVYRRLGG